MLINSVPGATEAWTGPNGGVDLLFPGETKSFSLFIKPVGEARGFLKFSVSGEYGDC